MDMEPALLNTHEIDRRPMITALQQLQVVMRYENAGRDPNLADLFAFVQSAQQQFGESASLEDVIQALVIQDVERQMKSFKREGRSRAEKRQESIVL